jgi:Icc-related predicted phosphoesterase
MIKVVAFSDPHGKLPIITEPFDLMLICGDICPVTNHNPYFQREWLSTKFVEWVLKLPFADKDSKVVFIAGNHDFYLYQEPNPNKGDYSSIYTDILKPCGGRLVYLEDDEYIFDKPADDGKVESLKLYGTPWCKLFGSWAFMRDYPKLEQYYDNIPEGLDILMTHDAPDIQGCGKIKMGPWKGENAGNKALASAIRRKEPRYVFSGHIHSANHTLTKVYRKNTYICNVSILNEDYYPFFQPRIMEIEGKIS